ncbi:MAG TPA: MFS transporter [Solirubrobacteraceae bacterium]|jgi:MFS family permease
MTTTEAIAGALPESRFGRRAGLAAATYAFTATMLGTTLPTPLYSLYTERFGFSELIVTVIFATYAAGVIAALLLLGRVSDVVGRRPVLLLGLAMSALSAVVFLLAQGLAPLLVGRLLSGLSAGIFTGTATATLVDLAGPEARGRATLVAAVANIGGLGCGPLLAGILAQLAPLPLRLSFWVDLGLLVPAFVGVLLMPEPVRPEPGKGLRVQALSVPRETRSAFIPAALAGFAGFAVMGLSTAVSPAFLGQVLSITSDVVVGAVVFGVFAASVVGQFLLEIVSRRTAMAAGCAGLIAGMALLAAGLAASSLAVLVIGATVAGAGQGLSFRAALAAVNEASPPDQRAEVASSFFVVAYLAISIPVIGEGVLAQAAGLRTAGIVFAAAVAVLAAVVVTMLLRRRGPGVVGATGE